MQRIDGQKIQSEKFARIRTQVQHAGFSPRFTDILIGDDVVNKKYVAMKKKVATSLGFEYLDVYFPDNTSEQVIIDSIARLNATSYMAGIIVQLPLPARYNTRTILNSIDPRLDVDVLGDTASTAFYANTGSLSLPTAQAVIDILETLPIDIMSMNIVVLGQGPLVGKPVAHLLRLRNCKVSIVTRDTPHKEKIEAIKDADIIISAMGVPRAITGDMVKDGVVVIDAGTSEMEGAIVGDIDFDSVAVKASYITPSPGGVGPVTIGCLFENVCKQLMQ